MPILNYTTEISTNKTIGEIQCILGRAKAQAIMLEYDNGMVSAISFKTRGPFGIVSFRLPANIDKLFSLISRSKKIPVKKRTREQAARVAFRILKDWLEAQMALIEVEMVTMEQVFLPYAQNSTGATLYETLAEGKFSGLALPAPAAP